MKTMRKSLCFAVAILLMASCSEGNYVGDKNLVNQETDKGAIAFGAGSSAITRGDSYGADAAAKLHNRFVVGGFKKTGETTYEKVFDNYGVEWTTNTAGKTASNTSDWDYVGKMKSPVSQATSQTVKYWDYSTSSYDFIAYSTGTATEVSGDPQDGQVKVTAIDHTNKGTSAFTLTGGLNELAGCYIADMVTVNKANYDKEVQLTFHSIASKVRIGLYETIPGYNVTNVKFYQAHPSNLGEDSGTTPYLIGSFTGCNSLVVSYNGNSAHVTPSGDTHADYESFGSFPSTAIGKTSTTTTFAGTNPYYKLMMPNAVTGALELAVDYTLQSEDGSGEVIHIYGATARVPAAYTKWLPNYAYTYIFKISDNTNGWTSTSITDPAGLYPITFDAVVLDEVESTKEQTTITTVSTPCITTYQKDHVYTDGPEYAASNDNPIFVQVMVDGNLKGDLGTKGQLYTLSAAGKSEADVLNALSIQTASDANTITGRNGLVLTKATSNANITAIPGVDGNDITVSAGQVASFAATAGNYAYVYDTGEWDGIEVTLSAEPTGWPNGYYTNKACTTAATGEFAAGTYYQKVSYIYSAETMTASEPTDWSTPGLWYKDPNGETAAGDWDADNNGKVFYKRYTVDNKIYGVKVIKVQ